MSKLNKIQLLVVMILMGLMVGCDNSGGIIQDVQNEVNTAVYYAEETVNVSSEMIGDTLDGQGAFSCAGNTDC